MMVSCAGLPRYRITSLQTNPVLGVLGAGPQCAPVDAGSRPEPGGLLGFGRCRNLLGTLVPAAG